MCGNNEKPCAICYCGDGGCLASMRDDYWMQATEEQLINRIMHNKYSNYTDLMINKLREWYNINIKEN